MTHDLIGPRVWRWLCLTVLLCAADAWGSGADAPPCDDSAAIGHLGISRIEGDVDVVVDSATDFIRVRFLAEPRVQRIDSSGPARELLREGDTIIAVNGELITTERAGRVLADPPVGKQLELLVRRQGKEMRVPLVAEWICPDNPRSLAYGWLEAPPPAAPPDLSSLPSPPELPAPEPPGLPLSGPPPPESPALPMPGLPHVWLGMGLRCSIEGHEGDGTLRFTEPPKVFRVQKGSAADQAGFRPGDLIIHIDGLRIDTAEGTLRFERIAPGDQVSWTVMRGRKTRELSLTADVMPVPVPPAVEAVPVPPPAPAVEQLRYSGAIGSTGVEVHSVGPVSVHVDDAHGQLVIRTTDATIHLWATGADQGIH